MWKLFEKAVAAAVRNQVSSKAGCVSAPILNSARRVDPSRIPSSSTFIFSRGFITSKSLNENENENDKLLDGAGTHQPEQDHPDDTDAQKLQVLHYEEEQVLDDKEIMHADSSSAKKKGLFTDVSSLSELTEDDINTYIKISKEDLAQTIGEGLPDGLLKEYEETKGSALLVRATFLQLRDQLKSCVEKTENHSPKLKPRKQFILDGPVSSGKSVILAMLVHWARSEGWFVFYVPKARSWAQKTVYYKNPVAPSWDTPVVAETVLGTLLKSHETLLQKLPCQIFDPIVLGEAPEIGMMQDAEAVAMPEGCTLLDLVQTGLACPNAAVGVVVRLREELLLVNDVPVLFAVDQYNSWFTFSDYKERTGPYSTRPVHARELTMVKPYRTMLHDKMMVTAYSHSTAVGRLREHLPDTPPNVRYTFPRYDISEAEAVVNYYYRQNLISQERFNEEKWRRIFFLTNGNGTEIRNLVRFI